MKNEKIELILKKENFSFLLFYKNNKKKNIQSKAPSICLYPTFMAVFTALATFSGSDNPLLFFFILKN